VRYWSGVETRISELKGVDPNDVTLLIPSRGRPKSLEALLAYLESKRVPFRILVLESGHTYSDLIKRFGNLNIEVSNYSEQVTGASQLHDAGARVNTPVVCRCTGDDVTIVDGIIKCTA